MLITIKKCSNTTLKFIKEYLIIKDNIVSIDDINYMTLEREKEILTITKYLVNKTGKTVKDLFFTTKKWNNEVSMMNNYFSYQGLKETINNNLLNLRLNYNSGKQELKYSDLLNEHEIKLFLPMVLFNNNKVFENFLAYSKISNEDLERIIYFINELKNNDDFDSKYIESNKDIVKMINNLNSKMQVYFGFNDLELFINKITLMYVLNNNIKEKNVKIKK